MSVPERKALIETNGAELPVSTQAELLGLNRSSLYYKPVAPDEEDLKIKRMIDELYTAHPEFSYRRMCVWLNKEKKRNYSVMGWKGNKSEKREKFAENLHT